MGDEWWMEDQLREMAAENVASSVAEEEVAEVFQRIGDLRQSGGSGGLP